MMNPSEPSLHAVTQPLIRARFGKYRGAFPDPPVIAVFKGHPEVGDVVILDDGDEVSLEITGITHGHFNAFHLVGNARSEQIAEDLASFLEQLFADRVLFWRSRSGSSGGWRELQDEKPRPEGNVLAYLWSGPIV